MTQSYKTDSSWCWELCLTRIIQLDDLQKRCRQEFCFQDIHLSYFPQGERSLGSHHHPSPHCSPALTEKGRLNLRFEWDSLWLLEPRGGLWVKGRWRVWGWDVISVPADMWEETDSAGREASTVPPAHPCSVTHSCPRWLSPTVHLEILQEKSKWS